MLNLIAAMVLTVSAAATGGQDDSAEQWGCAVSIEGSQGSSVMVSRQQTTGGTVVSQNVGWTPPVVDRFAPRGPRPDAPELTVFYALTEQGEIGSVDMVLGSATSVGGAPTLFAGGTLSLDMDAASQWTVDLPARSIGPEYRIGGDPLRHRNAFFRAPELPALLERGGLVTLSLRDGDGYLAAQTRHDLTHTGERDRLFIEARDTVKAIMQLPPDEAIARHPECARATGTLSPELAPPDGWDPIPVPGADAGR